MNKKIAGFSKLSKTAKIEWLSKHFPGLPDNADHTLRQFWLNDESLQKVLDGFSENTISNYLFPYGVAPNFVINGHTYCVPMVIEESSVVAAASSAAKYWMDRGGFHAEVVDTVKIGQVHFSWKGDFEKLQSVFPDLRRELMAQVEPITCNMEKRGGGVRQIQLLDFSHLEPDYYQLRVEFETCDSMGANFINSVLENFGQTLETFMDGHPLMQGDERRATVIMCILSNYTPECLVRAWVECPIEALGTYDGVPAGVLAEKFHKAVRIAQVDPYRATTHNKGIYNGVDAVVLATGNDFRAVEACGHTFAARDGQYRSLSYCTLDNGIFRFWLDLPIALGTVGGLTRLHPLAKLSLELLGNPSARQLMEIIGAVGLAQNFAAVRSLVTSGIQKGHMKMHLGNILNHLHATETEIEAANAFFADKVVSFTAVREFLESSRNNALTV